MDFLPSSEEFITLQGAAGTGKTSVIGYLQKIMNDYNFIYMAPTHAATAELAFATVKSGNKTLPMTVASSIRETENPITKEKEGALTQKLSSKLALGKNVVVIDEVSMLSAREYDLLKKTMKKNKIKVIFMGDILQIPEVNVLNPEKKLVSKAFTDNDQVVLSEVKRTSSDTILQVLQNIRKNVNGKIPLIEGSPELSYLDSSEFFSELAEKVKESAEDTVYISYTNANVKSVNSKIRQALGRQGKPVAGDIIVGYGGYNSKQIEKRNIANSIRYIITSIEKDNENKSVYNIIGKSSKLKYLSNLGVSNVNEDAGTSYYQLSENDSLKFDDLTDDDFERNNLKVSSLMKELYDAKQRAISGRSPLLWRDFYITQDKISKFFQTVNLGGEYIFNPSTGRMEEFNYLTHKNIVKSNPELKIEKGIDYGHAITIHKSQGSTVKNVFFDANTLPKGEGSKLFRQGEQIGTEKHSLLYVGMSRASDSLFVNKENIENFYIPETSVSLNNKPDNISQKEWDALSQEEKNKINEC